ncbi:MAG: peptidase M49 [Bryobacteraceae bacterium]|jgi:dipeptidyl-peptidase-3
MRVILTVFLLCGLAPAADDSAGVLVERVGDTGFIQLASDSFHGLTPRQKELAWWLTQASIAVDPIIYDQLSRLGLRQKALLEMIVAHPGGVDPAALPKIVSFTKLFWANRGNHNELTARKFLPEFTWEELRAAGLAVLHHRAKGMMTEAQFLSELDELRPSLFDAEFEPMITAKSPRGGLDILQASANNFYEGVSLADLASFTEHYPLNSRLVNADGALREEVYRAGTPDGSVPAGRYAQFLKRANEYLARAQKVAEPEQAKAIGDLIRFYQTGDPRDWLQFGADWVRNNATVDFANGFIEVYRDARGAKGTSQSFVTITDQRVNALMQKVAANAQYFENKAPWADQYKKQGVQPPLAKAVEALIETGDFSVITVGDNLPNEDEIHQKYGSKSFLFTGPSRALNRAAGVEGLHEFSWSEDEFRILKAHGDEAEDLMTALHEIIGHGSGRLNPKLAQDPAFYLKQYYSTLEEARADLMALWNVGDPRLRELGLISTPDVAKAMYYRAAMAPLTQLRRNPKGDTLEEDHERDRQLIVEYIIDKTGGIAKKVRDGRTYYHVDDFEKMRKGVGLLLAELMRIKAEGDYDAIKALIDRYGVHFDPALRDQVVERYRKLGLPSYWAGINPELDADVGPGGAVRNVRVTYPRDVARQYLRYSAMYDPRLAP